MKKNLLVFALFYFSICAVYAQIPRKKVVFECGTGTWCGACPPAQIGLHDLINNGKNAAVIDYHYMDSYNIPDASARISYYGINAYPTSVVDGTKHLDGGGNNVYSVLLPNYDTAIAKLSPVDILISIDYISSATYTAHLKVIKKQAIVPAFTLQTALTQSNISEVWYGQPTVEFVLRKMYPSSAGTAVSFISSDTFSFDIPIVINIGTWGGSIINGDFEFTAFVQESNKKIDQGDKVNFNNLTVDVNNLNKETPDFRIYPNPSSEKCRIAANFDSEKNVIVKIFNMLGDELISENIGKTRYGNIYEINTSNLAEGMYIMSIIADSELIVRKLDIK